MVTSPIPGMSSVWVWAKVHDIGLRCWPEVPCTVSVVVVSATTFAVGVDQGDVELERGGDEHGVGVDNGAGAASAPLSTSVTA
jgi:hypothetical protein